jgi:uncharacterized membrane-anchored protein
MPSSAVVTIGERDPVRTPVRARAALSKVPEITAWFWVIKVLTTGMGETASDWLAHTLAPPVAVGLGAIALIASLALQFTARRYVAWIYWLAAERDGSGGSIARCGDAPRTPAVWWR